MADVYWSCLIGGIVFAVITIVASDSFGRAMDGIGHSVGLDGLDIVTPATLVSVLTTFGLAGILLSEYTSITGVPGLALAALVALALGIGLHVLYVRPMRRQQRPVDLAELRGELGAVTVAIPTGGRGEATVRRGEALVSAAAASLDGSAIGLGQLVVVVEVRGDTLFVKPVDDGGIDESPMPARPRATLVG